MPISHNPPWKSDTKPVTAGATTEFFDFVPPMAPDGGRVVVDKWILCVAGIITVAGANWDGRDVARLAAMIDVEKRDGRHRWMLSGYKSRIASILLNGIEEHTEHANINIAAGAAVSLRLLIPMRKPFTKHPGKYSLPADAFKKIAVTWASLGSAGAGATLSAATLNAYVLAEWHSEHEVRFKTDDLVKSVDFNSNTQGRTSLSGVVHDLLIVKEDATAGGAAVSAITDARIEDLGTPLLTFGDLQDSFTRKRQIAPSGFGGTPSNERFLDPVRESKCLPVIAAGVGTSAADGKFVESLKVDVGTGAAGLSMITREVISKSEADYQATVARYNVDPKTIVAHNDNGTKAALAAQPSKRHKQVAEWSAPLPGRKAAPKG